MSIAIAATRFRSFLNHPAKVAMSCFVFLCVYLILNGTVFRLWSLNRDQDRLTMDIQRLKQESSHLQVQLKEAKDPSFIEKQARDRLDLVGENDLVFVFAND